MVLHLERRGDVAVVHWRDGENRFNTRSVAAWHAVLDELEAVEGPLAVVVTGEGKFFSNGLDLDSFGADPAAAGAVVAGVERLFGRMLLLNAYTVGAFNGHVFAAGAMLGCCLDARVMRRDRGYWCLPEVDLGLPLTPAMFATVTARLTAPTAAEAMNTGRRYSAEQALAAGIVEHTADEHDVLDTAVALAAAIAPKSRAVIGEHKRLMFAAAARACGVGS